MTHSMMVGDLTVKKKEIFPRKVLIRWGSETIPATLMKPHASFPKTSYNVRTEKFDSVVHKNNIVKELEIKYEIEKTGLELFFQ